MLYHSSVGERLLDRAYQTWLWVFAGGVVVGLFLRPRTVALASAGLFAASIVGLVGAGLLGYENAAMLFGIAAMIIPLFGVIATIGAAVGTRLWRRKPK